MTIPKKSIDFLIIGAAKAGTTSLASWLGSHPDVCMSDPKETMFFGSPKLFDQGINTFHCNFFAHYQGESLIGDATPAYSNRDRHPGTPQRVFNVNPDAKIIYIVRHPLRKVESSWQMHINLDPELVRTPEHRISCLKAREGFGSYIEEPSVFENMVNVCKYGYQLQAWRELFVDRQIHVMFLEDVVSDRDAEVAKLCSFLGVDSMPLLNGQTLKPKNTLQQRRTQRSFVQHLAKTGFQRLAPTRVKTFLAKSPLFSVSQASTLKADWPSQALEQFVEDVSDDVKKFLVTYGKSVNFYSFPRAEV
jgi:hypothetical protein